MRRISCRNDGPRDRVTSLPCLEKFLIMPLTPPARINIHPEPSAQTTMKNSCPTHSQPSHDVPVAGMDMRLETFPTGNETLASRPATRSLIEEAGR